MRTLLILLATLAVPIAAPWADEANQNRQDRRERTTIFVCGQDQELAAPIPVQWSAIVLAGDGRLYSPCPAIPPIHREEHRENRERSVIVAGFAGRNPRSVDPEARWRAAQAQARLARPLLSEIVPVRGTFISGPDRGMEVVRFTGDVVGDSLGGLISGTQTMTIVPACNSVVQVFPGVDTSRWQPGPLFRLLRDYNIAIQKEAAYAIGRRLAESNLGPSLKSLVIDELKHCLLRPMDPEVAGLALEAFGTSRFATDEQRTEIEALLVRESQGAPLKILGAVKGLEGMIRLDSQRTVADATRVRLRQLAVYGVRTTEAPPLDIDARIRRLAMLALQAARDTHFETMRLAAADGDWQVRRIVAARLNLSDPEQARLLVPLETDAMFQVRYELLSPLSRLATRTGVCAPIVARFKDPSPIVAMRAMDMLVGTCADLEDATKKLTDLADKLAKPEEDVQWHLTSRALTALARVKPDLAKPRLAAAVKHAVWQVRAAAAAASVALADEGAAVILASDPEPNVRTPALDALSRMKSPQVVPQAIDALKNGTDYQLLRTAAMVLRGVGAEERPVANDALLGALARLTEHESDTSRDPRVAILERLGETLGADRSNDLIPYTIDYDDEVIQAARTAFHAIIGVAPAGYPPRRRYPYQPTEEALSSLPKEAEIHLEEGTVVLKLLTDVAPVTVARFAALVGEGFYKDRTFHRIAPNFVVQGGSPGANEYSGTSRYMRDEPGPQAVHVRGAVGISTRGADTGDGQLFIDLIDLPRLDRDYTVFAYVTRGMEFVDRLLEGAKIVNISVK